MPRSSSTGSTAWSGGDEEGEMPGWRLSELELLPGGRHGSASAVNDAGVVVGGSDTVDDTNHAVLWREGRVIDLGTLGGWNSGASDVNAHETVVGWSETEPGTRAGRVPCIWRDGDMVSLVTLGAYTDFAPVAINDRDWVVGSSRTKEGLMHAFVWRDGEMVDLGTLVRGVYQTSRAADIDNSGRVVGRATVDSMNTVPVMWEDGEIRRLTERLGAASAINSRGQVVGGLATGPESFLWSDGDLTVIGPIASEMYVQAHGVDRDGRVVGTTGFRAFIWHGGVFEWLPGLSTGSSAPSAISDNGRFIVGGSSATPDGLNPRPVIWTNQ
jgi:probable HAF family extracellular repeat protein